MGVTITNRPFLDFLQGNQLFPRELNYSQSGADWTACLPCQVSRLVRRPGGPPRQMLKDGVERRRGPLARERGIYLDKLYAHCWWGRSA